MDGRARTGFIWRAVVNTVINLRVPSNGGKLLDSLWNCYFPNRALPRLFLPFLSAFAKLRKATVSFVLSVRLSSWNKLGSHWTDFHEIWYLDIF